MEGLLFLAQDSGDINPIFGLLGLVLMVVMFAGLWRINEKAGQPGWACIVPFYNIIVLLRIAGLSPILLLGMFVPLVNIIVSLYIWMRVAKAFGQSEALGCLVAFLPFVGIPLLGFGNYEYRPID